jgi:hypothetical protein
VGRSCSTNGGEREWWESRKEGAHWEDKMDLREIGWNDFDWTDLAQDMDQRRSRVNTVMSLRVP